MPPRILTLRYSELATLADCQLKYKLAYAERLTNTSKPRLVLGTAFHALLEGHYKSFREDDNRKQPRNLAKAREAAGAQLNAYIRSHREDARHINDEMLELLRWMYAGYVERWGDDPQYKSFPVIEEERVVPLISHLGVKVLLRVTADLVVYHRDYDRYLIVDHKTLSGRDAGKAATAKENWLDPQRLAYSAAYSLQGPKKGRLPIFGAVHNTVRADKLKREMILDERFGRAAVYFNETELRAGWEELRNLAKDAVEIRLGRGRALRMYASPDPQTCAWKCQFKEVHLTARATGRDPAQVAIDYGFERTESDEFVGVLTEPEPKA